MYIDHRTALESSIYEILLFHMFKYFWRCKLNDFLAYDDK